MLTHEGLARVADSYSLEMSDKTREDILSNVSKTKRTALSIENEFRHFATEGRQVDRSGWKQDGCLGLPLYNASWHKISFGVSGRAIEAQLIGREFNRKHACN